MLQIQTLLKNKNTQTLSGMVVNNKIRIKKYIMSQPKTKRMSQPKTKRMSQLPDKVIKERLMKDGKRWVSDAIKIKTGECYLGC